MKPAKRRKLLIVGAFLGEQNQVYGGVARSCEILMSSSFTQRFDIVTVDSTQISNPPPSFLVRLSLAAKRLIIFTRTVLYHRPNGVILFASLGASFVEKSLMALLARLLGSRSYIFPRAGALIERTEKAAVMYALVKILLRGAHVFLSQGKTWSNFALGPMKLSPSRVFLIPNWTATEAQLTIGRQRDLSTEVRPKLLFVGWLEAYKGTFDLLEAVKQLRSKGYDFELTLAGRGNEELTAKKFVEGNSLDNVINFAGWVGPEELSQLLITHNIFVLPSWAEGLPNSMIEAMAAGLAVVVTRVGMIPDYLVDGEHALLVPAKDTAALEIAIEKLLIDAGLRKKIAQNGFNLASQEFAVEPAVAKLADVIHATL